MYGCVPLLSTWNYNHKEGWALKNWCFWNVGALESLLDCRKIKPVDPKGNQPWLFCGRTDAEAEAPVLWPPESKCQLIRKEPDARKDWRQEEKSATEGEMVGWHHWLNGHEFEQALGDSEGQGSVVSMGLQRVRHDLASEQQYSNTK